MIKVEITKQAIEYLSEHLGYGADNSGTVEEIGQMFVSMCRITPVQEGQGTQDHLYKTALTLLKHYDEQGPIAFYARVGGVAILDVCRKIIAEGEGNPHPWI